MRLVCALIFFVQMLVLAVATGQLLRDSPKAAAVGAAFALLNMAGFAVELFLWSAPAGKP